MSTTDLLRLADRFEKIAQQSSPSKVFNIGKQTLKGIINHPTIIPQAIDQVWSNFLEHINWLSISPAKQQEINRKIMIAKKKQEEDTKRIMQEIEYEIGKETTLQSVDTNMADTGHEDLEKQSVLEAAYDLGYESEDENCPFPEGSPEAKEWWEGYEQGELDW